MAFDIFNFWDKRLGWYNWDNGRTASTNIWIPKSQHIPIQHLKQFVIDDNQATLVLIDHWVSPPNYRDQIVFDDIRGGRLLVVSNDGNYREINTLDHKSWVYSDLRNTEYSRVYFLPDSSNSETYVKFHVEASDSNVSPVYDSKYTMYFDVQDITSNSSVKFGTNNADSLYGSDMNDMIHGLAGNDFISGEGGKDAITGGPGDDRLLGGDGDDILYGSAGVDWLNGGEGHDFLYGGEGNDTYYFYKGAGRDEIFDLQGENTLQFADDIRPQDLTIDTTGNDLGHVTWNIHINGTDDQIFIHDQYSNVNKTLSVTKFIFGNDFVSADELSDLLGLPHMPIFDAENPVSNFTIEDSGYNDLFIPISDIPTATYPEYMNVFVY